jgi:hypothetical protein
MTREVVAVVEILGSPGLVVCSGVGEEVAVEVAVEAAL